MNYQHPSLASGRWQALPLVEQMANIGSEVERALRWRAKGHEANSQKAFERSLELMDLTLQNSRSFPRLKEVARMKEIWIDYFLGPNQYASTPESWKKYFYHFTFAARRNFK